MKLIKSFLTKNPCYTSGKKIVVKGLMLHSIGCPQPKASVFINSWNHTSFNSACVHGFIDGNDGTVYQTLPWNHRGWHAGSSANNTHIGVEMCEPACIKYTSASSFICSDKVTAKTTVKRTYEAAVELFAMLCKQFNLDPLADGVIISHKEGHARGIASNHGDPEHLWKGLGMDCTMNTFRKAVKEKMNGTKEDASVFKDLEETQETYYYVRKTWEDSQSQIGAYRILANAKTCADKNPDYFVFDADGKVVYPISEINHQTYLVRINIDDLNIRKGPGTNYAKTGKCTGKGSFTIVDEKEGEGASRWGLLKAYADKRDGWVSLDYCTKC